MLQLLERFTGVRETNISQRRRQTFGDLILAPRLRRSKNAPPAFPDTSGPLCLVTYEAAKLSEPVLPTTDQSPPIQARGKRTCV